MTELLVSDRARRQALSNQIKSLGDVLDFPRLSSWNYEACEHHKEEGPQVDCAWRKCGGDLFSHQRVGTLWLYTVKHGLLADDPGTGKTNTVLALVALLKQRNELGRRALIIPNTPATKQWGEEISRWCPGVSCVVVDGSVPRKQRINLYASEWDVAVVGSHVAINDKELLKNLAPFDLVISDDVDALLNHSNRTHKAIRALAKDATHSFTVNATTVQTRLHQLHAALVPAGGYDEFGSLKMFENRYVRTELVSEWERGKLRQRRMATGYKNTDELKAKVRNLYLRRRATELTDVRMPELMPPVVEWFELSSAQRTLYAELQEGILKLMREEGEHVKHLNALTKWLYGQQICAGLPALGMPDGPEASPKLDRLFHNLETVWTDRKTVVFVKNVGMVKACINRAREADIGMAMVWGQKQNSDQRKAQVDRFWEDPDCRLLVGTTSLERSLNLQVANTVVAIDTHLNPARMRQILGRAKRAGSAYDRVFMFTYLMRDTQEERYLRILAERQAISDTVFDEESDMYERLSPTELLMLMRP